MTAEVLLQRRFNTIAVFPGRVRYQFKKTLAEGARHVDIEAVFRPAMQQGVDVKQAGGAGLARLEIRRIHIQGRAFAQYVTGLGAGEPQDTTAVALIGDRGAAGINRARMRRSRSRLSFSMINQRSGPTQIAAGPS